MNDGPFQLPAHWRWATFSDVARVAADLVDPTQTPDAPHIAPNHIESWTGALLPYKTIREDGMTSAKHRFRKGQILYSKIRPYLAKAALASFDGLCSADMYPIETELEPGFLLRWMLTPTFTNEASGSQGRTVLPKINRDALARLRVPVAPLNEQRRIVAKLDSIFVQTRAAKARVERLPAMLEKLKRSILAAAFRGDLTADWRASHSNVEPANALLDRIRAEHRARWEDSLRAKGKVPAPTAYRAPTALDADGLPELPSGWAWASVDEVAELQLGQQRAPIHANAEETHPYVRAANIKWDGLDLSDVKQMGFPDPERYRLRYGDVLLSEASGSASEVGKPAIWRDEIPGCCYQKTLLRARPRSSDVTSEWLHAAFLADALLGRFARMAPGVGILHLTADRMLGWPVPVAPAPEQHVLVERMRHALDAVSKLENVVTRARQNVERVEQATLGRAFRGELVAQDPSDEPVSALLDSLRSVSSAESAHSRKAERKARGRSRRVEESRT